MDATQQGGIHLGDIAQVSQQRMTKRAPYRMQKISKGGVSYLKHQLEVLHFKQVEPDISTQQLLYETPHTTETKDIPVLVVCGCFAVVPRDGLYLKSVVQRLVNHPSLSLSTIFVPIPHLHELPTYERESTLQMALFETNGVKVDLVMSSQDQYDQYFKSSMFRKCTYAELISGLTLYNDKNNVFVLQQKARVLKKGEDEPNFETLIISAIGYNPADLHEYTHAEILISHDSQSGTYIAPLPMA